MNKILKRVLPVFLVSMSFHPEIISAIEMKYAKEIINKLTLSSFPCSQQRLCGLKK